MGFKVSGVQGQSQNFRCALITGLVLEDLLLNLSKLPVRLSVLCVLGGGSPRAHRVRELILLPEVESGFRSLSACEQGCVLYALRP